MDSYRVPAAPSRAELRERGSMFLAYLLPIGDAAAARAEIESLRRRHPDATHHCWAWRLGDPPVERSSDAGEPAGTAGVPMLQVLRGAALSDVLAVAVRWFGGTKLGKGGLARAYAGVVRTAVEAAGAARRVPTVRLQVELPYERMGDLERLIHPPEVEVLERRFAERATIVLRVRRPRLAALRGALADLGLGVVRSSG